MQTARYRSELIYDPNESYEQYYARRQQALEQGRLAIQEKRISRGLFLFYEYLVERVGANRYTWVSEETMAEVFGVDESTIKRWIGKLVRAGLIRRQRQFGTTSRTYLTAYDPTTVLLDGQAEDAGAVSTTHPTIDVDQVQVETVQTQEAQGSQADAVSFRRNDAPTFGADLRRDHIKVPQLNLGGGEKRYISQNQPIAPEIRMLLEREGVSGFYLAPQIQQQPLDELRAVSRYLDHQHNVRDRARLFAALAAQGFGGLLLAGRAPQGGHSRQDRGRPPKATSARVDDPLRYVSGELAQYIKGVPPQAASAPPPSDPVPTGRDDSAASTHGQIWEHVLAALRSELTEREFDTWFDEARLLHLEANLAVIGTPNIFAREKLTDCYQAQIAQALSARCGRSIQVQFAIGG